MEFEMVKVQFDILERGLPSQDDAEFVDRVKRSLVELRKDLDELIQEMPTPPKDLLKNENSLLFIKFLPRLHLYNQDVEVIDLVVRNVGKMVSL
jgi:hypothetical protein